jgi:TetR/AcrR family transcriptional regulator
MPKNLPKTTQTEAADRTRKAILDAAIAEFSAHGLAGARTEAIAELAGANKALLYYYFKSKRGLYTAAIQAVSERVVEDALMALDPAYSPGERLLRTALNHFDRILTQREFQSLLQQEMVRYQKDEGGEKPVIFESAFKPLIERQLGAINEGMRSGELCKVDGLQIMYSIFGANVFYFMSAPMVRLALPYDPFDPEALRARREASVRFLGSSLFVNRSYGNRLARKVLKAVPMPQVKDFKFRRGFKNQKDLKFRRT